MTYGEWPYYPEPASSGYSWGASSPPPMSYTVDPSYITTTTTTLPVKDFTLDPPIEYKLHYDGSIKWKGEYAEDYWHELDEDPDPFAVEPKKKKVVKARIKLDKKLAVDVDKLADMLF